jgi:hypothetical protein
MPRPDSREPDIRESTALENTTFRELVRLPSSGGEGEVTYSAGYLRKMQVQ